MLLLAVDTSGRVGSLALARVQANEMEILDEVALAGGDFSAQLVPQTSALLQKHAKKKSDLAGFAVASGPGSFTGLRVGLAAIKAMADVLRLPIAAVSLLEVVARSGQAQGRVFSLLDAGRNELYVGDYELGPPIRTHYEKLLSREEFSAENKDRVVLTSDETIRDFAHNAGFRVRQVAGPTSADIARLGWERIRRGETIAPENLEANYIRRTDAEIFSKPKV